MRYARERRQASGGRFWRSHRVDFVRRPRVALLEGARDSEHHRGRCHNNRNGVRFLWSRRLRPHLLSSRSWTQTLPLLSSTCRPCPTVGFPTSLLILNGFLPGDSFRRTPISAYVADSALPVAAHLCRPTDRLGGWRLDHNSHLETRL
jgi:hypothetical protein